MAELLNREKDFIKMNEELNKLSFNVKEISPVKLENCKTSNDNRYQTYTKSKKMVTKHGEFRQCQSPQMEDSDCYGPKLTHTRNFDEVKGQNGSNNSKVSNFKNNCVNANDNCLNSNPYRKNNIHDNRNVTQRFIHWDRRKRNSKKNVLEICFQNANFNKSPSFDTLVREESTSMQNELDIEAGLCDAGDLNKKAKRVLSKPDSLTKFLREKIAILEESHERLAGELAQQKIHLEGSLEHSKQINKQLEQVASKNNTLSEELAKAERLVEDAKLIDKQRLCERGELLKELEAFKVKVNTLTREKSCFEKRLFRAQEEILDLKTKIKDVKATERQIQNSIRTEDEKKNMQIKILKKQRIDILNAYKKQLFLIDNLKHQNICLEQSKKVAISEKEFNKLLDGNKKTMY